MKFDDEYDSFLQGRGAGGKYNIDKCAYILVYEKTQKRPLTFEFDKSNIREKSEFLKNVREDKLDQVVTTVMPDGAEQIKVGFYDLKPNCNASLEKTIKDDNFRFLIEQHVFSRDFLAFITTLSGSAGLPEFDPLTLRTGIYTGPVNEDVKRITIECFEANLQFLIDVFAKTDDNIVS